MKQNIGDLVVVDQWKNLGAFSIIDPSISPLAWSIRVKEKGDQKWAVLLDPEGTQAWEGWYYNADSATPEDAANVYREYGRKAPSKQPEPAPLRPEGNGWLYRVVIDRNIPYDAYTVQVTATRSTGDHAFERMVLTETGWNLSDAGADCPMLLSVPQGDVKLHVSCDSAELISLRKELAQSKADHLADLRRLIGEKKCG